MIAQLKPDTWTTDEHRKNLHELCQDPELVYQRIKQLEKLNADLASRIDVIEAELKATEQRQ